MTAPVLAVDVDGVISLFGFDPPLSPLDLPGVAGSLKYELIDGTPHVISMAAGERLRRLRDSFELVWATGWQDRANDRLGPLLELPQLAVIHFDRTGSDSLVVDADSGVGSPDGAGTTPAHWKLDAVDRFAGSRPIAWVDDSFDESCFEWCEARESDGRPTLLVPTEPDIGLEEGHVAALEAWAEHLFRKS
ncbi:MAG: hypothetical protein M3Y45_03520 [Actinomycetota bacterium]|nr:hypothetical protein [Actinomycetota bacterium]